MGSFAWDLSVDNLCLGAFVWVIGLGTFAWDLSLGNFGLEAFARDRRPGESGSWSWGNRLVAAAKGTLPKTKNTPMTNRLGELAVMILGNPRARDVLLCHSETNKSPSRNTKLGNIQIKTIIEG